MQREDRSHKETRIAMVVSGYGLVGGVESYVRQFCEQLAADFKYEIHVFANKWRKSSLPIIFHRVPIIPFPRFFRPISFAYFAKRAMSGEKFALVHSHERIFAMDVFTVHGLPHRTWKEKVRRKRMSLFDRSTAWVESKGIHCDRICAILPVSELVKEGLLNVYDIPKERIHVIHPGIGREQVSVIDKEESRSLIRERHGLSQEDLILLFVGMNFEIKGLDTILSGVAYLAQKGNRYSKLKVLVVGKGDTKKYELLSRRMEIQDRIIFAGVREEIGAYYRASDVFVMPSLFDTFGMAVLEAMAAGVPVIITRNVGARDLVENGVNGFILQDNPSPPDFGECVAMLLDKERRLRMGEMAQREASKHTWDQIAKQVSAIYEETLERRKGGWFFQDGA
jgi:UDP-glucose:(heptosyl)LPS alpha-1,3-glucosyltransferase